MGLKRTYRLTCDRCESVHNRAGFVLIVTHDTPRRARSAAHRDGWQRVQKGWNWWQDVCPACLDKEEQVTG